MQNLYIDESGSMTIKYTEFSPCFLIAIIKPNDSRKLKNLHKRFIKQNLEDLRRADKNGKMFIGGKFKELKGSEFTPNLKRKFLKYFCRDNLFEVYYIVIDNKKLLPNNNFYENTARAFNYLLKIAFIHFYKKKLFLKSEDYNLQLDERNERTKTKFFLEEYLNTELSLGNPDIKSKFTVKYFDSCNNSLIQIADVMANILYSNIRTQNYNQELKTLKNQNYIKEIFNFPK